MDKARSGLSPAIHQSSLTSLTCVRVQFDQFGCWVRIGSKPWCEPTDTSKLMWAHTQEVSWAQPTSGQCARSTRGDGRGEATFCGCTASHPGWEQAQCFSYQRNFILVVQCCQEPEWGMFEGVLLLLQLAAGFQVTSMQQSCSRSANTYLPCKCKLSNYCVAGKVFSVICLSLRCMTTSCQHVSQAHHSWVIPEKKWINYFLSPITNTCKKLGAFNSPQNSWFAGSASPGNATLCIRDVICSISLSRFFSFFLLPLMYNLLPAINLKIPASVREHAVSPTKK